MELKNILMGVQGLKAKGNLELDIPHIASDSREIKEGDLFIAVKGFEVDGHDYIENAIKAGAKARNNRNKRKNNNYIYDKRNFT